MQIRAAVAMALVGFLSACGGGGGGSGGGGGGGVGAGSNPPTAIAFIVPPTQCTGENIAGIEILLSTNRAIPNACADSADACVSFASTTGLSLGVLNFSNTSSVSPVAPGTYPISVPTSLSGTAGLVGATASDAQCNNTLTGQANPSGSITISSVNGSSVSGSYDVTVYGTHYSGSFTAAVCGNGLPQTDNCLNWTGQGGTCTGTQKCL